MEDFITLSAKTPNTNGGQQTVTQVSTESLTKWIDNGYAHNSHDAIRFPHRSDVCDYSVTIGAETEKLSIPLKH